MDSSIIYVNPNIEGIVSTAVFITIVLLLSLCLSAHFGYKFNKEIHSANETNLISYWFSTVMVGFFIFWIIVGSVLLIIPKAEHSAKEKESNDRIGYFQESYGANLTSTQLDELQYPEKVPVKGEPQVFGETKTLVSTSSYEDIVNLYLIWDGEEFILAETEAFSAR